MNSDEVLPSRPRFASVGVGVKAPLTNGAIEAITATFSGGLTLTALAPVVFQNAAAAANGKNWMTFPDATRLVTQTRSDDFGLWRDAWAATRVGVEITGIVYGNATNYPTHNLFGNTTINSTGVGLTIAGNGAYAVLNTNPTAGYHSVEGQDNGVTRWRIGQIAGAGRELFDVYLGANPNPRFRFQRDALVFGPDGTDDCHIEFNVPGIDSFWIGSNCSGVANPVGAPAGVDYLFTNQGRPISLGVLSAESARFGFLTTSIKGALNIDPLSNGVNIRVPHSAFAKVTAAGVVTVGQGVAFVSITGTSIYTFNITGFANPPVVTATLNWVSGPFGNVVVLSVTNTQVIVQTFDTAWTPFARDFSLHINGY